jgi:SAM-dependent methyltransferase
MTAGLPAAYAIASPEDCLRVYRDWAASYDAGFAQDMDYRLPAHVAAAFLAHGGVGPVLDVGAGTGLVAQALRGQGFADRMDAVDLSPEMLEAARAKGLYARLACADITRPLSLPGPYGGVVSAGTFTAGHVGPEALPHLLRVAATGALFALSVNLRVWDGAGFDTALRQDLPPRITGLTLVDVAIYGPAASQADPDHGADRARIVLFRKAAAD